jgi:hypothetical protein
MENSTVFLFLIALLCKHYLTDFVLQSDRIVSLKKRYLSYMLLHTGQHALATFVVAVFFVGFTNAVLLALLDMFLHTIIDELKIHIPFSNKPKPPSHAFFAVFGFDQLLHMICYVGYVWLVSILR